MPVSIATWNINSVRLRIRLVTRFLRDYRPDVLLLQEIKCTNDQFPRRAIARDVRLGTGDVLPFAAPKPENGDAGQAPPERTSA